MSKPSPKYQAIDAERLRALLHYDPETGWFTRRTTAGRWVAGERCGCVTNNGYRLIRVDGHLYMAHLLAWLYAYGEWPPHEIDHRNGERDDNQIYNLRSATGSENQWNKKIPKNNTSGLKGVSLHKQSGRWTANICKYRRVTYLGLFKTKEEASEAYRQEAMRLFGEFARFA